MTTSDLRDIALFPLLVPLIAALLITLWLAGIFPRQRLDRVPVLDLCRADRQKHRVNAQSQG